MDGQQFLEISKKHLNIPSEAAYRSAVSRAYYALFHAVATFTASLGFPSVKGPQAHGQLPARLNSCGVEEGMQIGRWLKELHRQRLSADYDLASEGFSPQFRSAVWVAQAEQAVIKLNAIAASPNLCIQIRNGIRMYKDKLSEGA